MALNMDNSRGKSYGVHSFFFFCEIWKNYLNGFVVVYIGIIYSKEWERCKLLSQKEEAKLR